MKKLLLIALALVQLNLFAQSPEKFNFQGAAKDASGNVLSNSSLGLRISILHNGTNGTAVYSESHNALTNASGIFSIQIGGGSLLSGNFANIDWGNGLYFVKVEVDPTGGTNYNLLSNTQLLSVPYALHAKTVGSIDWTNITNVPASLLDGDSDILAGLSCGANQVAVFNGTTWVCGNLSGGGSVTWGDITNLPANISAFAGLSCSAGQVAQYNGTTWTCVDMTKPQVFEVNSSSGLVLTPITTSYTVIPGMTQTITLTKPSKVYISSSGGFQCLAAGTSYSVADVGIHVNGSVATSGQAQITAANTTGLGNMLTRYHVQRTQSLPAGTHVIDVRAKDSNGTADGYIGGTSPLIASTFTIIVIPD